MITIYIQKIIKHWIWLVSSTIWAVLFFWIIPEFFASQQFVYIWYFFLISLFVISPYLCRLEEYREKKLLNEKLNSKYKLSATQEEILWKIYNKDTKDIYDKCDWHQSRDEKNLAIENLKDLENEWYIKLQWHSTGLLNVEITTEWKKYIEKRL